MSARTVCNMKGVGVSEALHQSETKNLVRFYMPFHILLKC